MAQPTPYKRSFSFTNAQEDDPDKPLPGPRLDIELDNISESSEALTAVVNASQAVIDNMDAVVTVSENIDDVVFVSQNTQTYRDAVDFAPDLATAVDLFLGARTVDPSTGHNGDPLVVGATYYNLISGVTRVWNGTIWVDGVAVNMGGVVQGTHTIAGGVKSVDIGDFAYVTVSKNGVVLNNTQFSTASPFITIPSAVDSDIITWFGIARGGIQEGAMYVQSTVQANIGQTVYSLDDDGQPLRLTQTNHALFYGGVDQRLMVLGDDYTIVEGSIVLAEAPTVPRRMVVLAMPRFTNTEAQVILNEYKDAVQAILDQFQDITATATTLPSGQPATAAFDPLTGVMAFGIPRGAAGDGSGDMVATLYDPQNIEADTFDRSNHTGEQPISSVTGLQAVLDSRVRFDAEQLLTEPQQTQARANIDAQPSGGYVRYDDAQTLTSPQQAQARANIGAGAVAIENVVPISKGGTGATTAGGARANIGAGIPTFLGIVSSFAASPGVTYTNPSSTLPLFINVTSNKTDGPHWMRIYIRQPPSGSWVRTFDGYAAMAHARASGIVPAGWQYKMEDVGSATVTWMY